MRFLVIFVLALAFAPLAKAYDASDLERASRAYRLALYDLPPAETLASSGGQAVRVYVDGAFSGFLPAIVIQRPRRGAARLTVISGHRRGGTWSRVTRSAAIPVPVWARLLADGTEAVSDWRAFTARRDDEAAHPATKPAIVSDIIICADGQDSLVEVASEGHVSRGAEHDCEFTELGDFATELAAAAIHYLPDCAAITPGQMYGGFSRLAQCGLLSGDKRSAIALMNRINEHGSRDLALAADAHIVADWAGRPRAVGAKAFGVLWSDLEASIGAHFQFEDIAGDGPAKAVATGWMVYVPKGDNVDNQRAPCTEVWRKSRAGWRLASLTVGAFHPFYMAHDPRGFT
ncbi:MAG: hypothetical protein ACHP7N_11840 [Caulobacterales bacterium]